MQWCNHQHNSHTHTHTHTHMRTHSYFVLDMAIMLLILLVHKAVGNVGYRTESGSTTSFSLPGTNHLILRRLISRLLAGRGKKKKKKSPATRSRWNQQFRDIDLSTICWRTIVQRSYSQKRSVQEPLTPQYRHLTC